MSKAGAKVGMSGFKDAWTVFCLLPAIQSKRGWGKAKRGGGIGLEGGGVHLAELGGCVMGGGESFDCLEVEAQTDNQRR